ncbi:MAG: HAD-IA family hydrolase [Eubacteriales bacterium]|nr:HAD-IA family hydrolase [Eubacteriales bacterium]
MSYKYVLFDMDGTVLNTLDDLRDAVNHTLQKFGMPDVSSEEVAHYLGNGAGHLIECSAPEGTDPALIETILAEYLPYYKANCRVKTAPYPGITDLMMQMKSEGIKMAVVSNKPDAATKELSELFFGDLVEITIGETPLIKRKPAPDTVFEAIRAMGADISECVYIGDTEVDIQTAENAGTDCISVTWGFRTEDELIAAGAKMIAHSMDELSQLIQGSTNN